MPKKETELGREVKSGLKAIEIKLSQLEVMQFNDFIEAHRAYRTPDSQFETQPFERRNLN